MSTHAGFPDPASPPLVGREREQAALREALAAALAGRGSLVLIGGEAGIGKTTLAEGLCPEATGQGALVLVGRCYELSETPPYGPWRDALAATPAIPDLPSLPALGGGAGGATAPASQAALFAGARDYLASLAARRPLVLLLEDLHWADPASLDLLRFLGRGLDQLPLLVLATYRADELTRQHPLYRLLPMLVREARAMRLDLHPLTADDLGLLVRRYNLQEAEETRLVAYLVARAEGNPFFMGELLRSLEEDHALCQAGEGWRLGDLDGLRVPPLLRQVIDARVARLGAEAEELLAVAATIGQVAPLDLWAAVARVDERALLAVIELAVAAHLLAETADGLSVRFAHALVREALYEGTVAPRRRELHRRAGEVLAASNAPDPDAVAYHFRRAGDARVGDWLVQAGERAEFAFAYETAVARFEEALPLLGGSSARDMELARALLQVARLLRQSATERGIGCAREALRLATATGDTLLAATARYRLGVDLCLAGHLRDGLLAIEAARDALATLPAAEDDRLARLDRDAATPWQRQGQYALNLALAGRYAEAEAEAEAVLAGGGRPPEALSHAANALTNVHPALGRVAAARAMFAATQTHFRAAKEFFVVVQSYAYELDRLVIPYLADQPAARAAVLTAGEEALRRLTGPFAGLPRSALRHGLDLLDGRWDEVEPLAVGAFGLRQGNALVRARIALARGEPGAAWDFVAGFVPASPDVAPGDAWFLGATAGQRLAADLALAVGDLPTARAWLAAHDRWLAWNGAVLGRTEGALGWAEYHRAAGDPERARASAGQALAHASAPRQPLALLAAQRLLGELDTLAGCHGDAAGHLDRALALADACAAPYARALTLLALAELRAATGDRQSATAGLDEARAILAPLGAAPALARAAALAARLADAPAPIPACLPGLTPREAEVLRLVAAGLTDAEVAARLVRSRRTIHHHLRAIYAKLGVSTRSAATRLALEHGLA